MKDKHRQDSYFKSCKCIVNIARSLFKLNVCNCLISICSSHKILFFLCVHCCEDWKGRSNIFCFSSLGQLSVVGPKKKKRRKAKNHADLAFMPPYYPVCKLPRDQTDGRPAAAEQDRARGTAHKAAGPAGTLSRLLPSDHLPAPATWLRRGQHHSHPPARTWMACLKPGVLIEADCRQPAENLFTIVYC